MLAEVGEIDPGYVALRAAQWVADAFYSWAVCDPTTGEMLAEVTVDPVARRLHTRSRPGHDAAAVAAAESVRRFAAAALGLTQLG